MSTSLTRNQNLVLDALAMAAEPQSAYALLDTLRSEGLRAPPQIYRALDKLQSLGLVHRIETLNAFVACAHPSEHRHGASCFAICSECGQAIEFTDPSITRRISAWGRDQGFEPEGATIEIRGRCAQCARH